MYLQNSILSLLLFTTTYAIPLLATRQRKLCNYPKTFTISRFTTFTPDSSNSSQNSIYFEIADDYNPTLRIKCRSKYTSSNWEGDVCEDNRRIFFRWDRNELKISYTIGVCVQDPNPITNFNGLLKPALMCYPTPLFLGMGAGTSCQTPVDQFSSKYFTEPITADETPEETPENVECEDGEDRR